MAKGNHLSKETYREEPIYMRFIILGEAKGKTGKEFMKLWTNKVNSSARGDKEVPSVTGGREVPSVRGGKEGPSMLAVEGGRGSLIIFNTWSIPAWEGTLSLRKLSDSGEWSRVCVTGEQSLWTWNASSCGGTSSWMTVRFDCLAGGGEISEVFAF